MLNLKVGVNKECFKDVKLAVRQTYKVIKKSLCT